MKTAIRVVMLVAISAVVIYAAVGPGVGVLFNNPLATIGTGMIGLGLTVEALRQTRHPARD